MSVYKVKPFLGDGGSGGGSEIVDALPAQGVEGKTYLLRKRVDESFKAKYYQPIYPSDTEFMVSDDFTLDDLISEIYSRTGIDPNNLPEWLHNYIEDNLPIVITTAEFEEQYGDATIVHNEDELPQTTDSSVVQYVGEVTSNDFLVIEGQYIDPAGESADEIFLDYVPLINSVMNETIINDSEIIARFRGVYYELDAETGLNTLVKDEWDYHTSTILGKLTGEIITNEETMQQVGSDECYLIYPAEVTPTYSYTEYVYDQGVYTEISAKSEGGSVNIALMTNINTGDYTFDLDKDEDSLLEMFTNNKGPIYIKNPNNKYTAIIYGGEYEESQDKYYFDVVSFSCLMGEGGGSKYYYASNDAQWKWEELE